MLSLFNKSHYLERLLRLIAEDNLINYFCFADKAVF